MLSRKKKARNGGVAHFILALHDTKRAHCRHVHRTLATQMHYTGHCGTVHGARVARWEVLRVLAVIGARVGTRTHPQSATKQDSVKKRTWYLNYFHSYYAGPLLDRIFLCMKWDYYYYQSIHWYRPIIYRSADIKCGDLEMILQEVIE